MYVNNYALETFFNLSHDLVIYCKSLEKLNIFSPNNASSFWSSHYANYTNDIPAPPPKERFMCQIVSLIVRKNILRT